MQEIQQLCSKILPVVETTLICYGRNKQLFPLQEAVHTMQMAFYWLAESVREMENLDRSTDMIIEDALQQKIEKYHSPSIIGSEEQMAYITSQLLDFNRQIQEFKESTLLPPQVQHKIDRGADNLMEGVFNMKLAKTYYEQLQGRGRGQ